MACARRSRRSRGHGALLRLDAGRQLCELLRGYGLYKSLLGVIPWPYRHARRLVRELGFVETRVPGMCNLPSRGRVVAGALVVKEL